MVMATARAFPSPSLDDKVMTKITESFMDGNKAQRTKHLLAMNKARSTREREGAAAANGVDAGPPEGAIVARPVASAEDPAAAQPMEKNKGGRMASGSGFTGKELKGSFGAPTPL